MDDDDSNYDYRKTKTNIKPNIVPISAKIPWSDDVLVKKHHSVNESPNKIWYRTENTKREQGLENEIDLTEIRQAVKGLKNRWYERVKAFPEVFKGVREGAAINWMKATTETQNDKT